MHHQALLPSGFTEALVVRDDDTQIGTEGQRRGHMHGVERAQLARIELAGAVDERFIGPNQLHRAEDLRAAPT
jgi:hypothetical protein